MRTMADGGHIDVISYVVGENANDIGTDHPHMFAKPPTVDPQQPVADIRHVNDWSTLPKDIYVVAAQTVGGIGFSVHCCSIPMVLVPEVRYTRADMMSEKSIQTSDTARDAFMNAIRILYSMEPDLPRVAYDRFIDSPCEFLMTADEPTLQKIWDAVQARQPMRYKQ